MTFIYKGHMQLKFSVRYSTLPRKMYLLFLFFVGFSAVANPNSREDHGHTPCRILFSEVLLHSPGNQFLEIAKVCPSKGRRNAMTSLDGYQVLVFRGNTQLTTIFSELLHSHVLLQRETGSMTTTSEFLRPNRQLHQQAFSPDSVQHVSSFDPDAVYVSTTAEIPVANGAFTSRIERDVNCQTFTNNTGLITRNRRAPNIMNGITKYIALVNFPPITIAATDFLAVVLVFHKKRGRHSGHVVVNEIMTESKIQKISKQLRDVVFLGSLPTQLLEVTINKHFIPKLSTENIIGLTSLLNVDPEGMKSINKCDGKLEMFDPASHQIAEKSPSEINKCIGLLLSVNEIRPSHPFSFVGQTLTPQTKKLILNTLWSIEMYKDDKPFWLKSTREIVSGLVNLATSTISGIQKTQHHGGIDTLTKRKPYPKPVVDSITPERKQQIYSVISSFYKENKIPKLEEVLNKFKGLVNTQILEDSTSNGNLFKCGIKSFRKILYSLGFKYGRLNKRDGILFDPRIINLRTKYLQQIRANDDLASDALPVLYTDETWFDTNSRGDRGWYFKCARSWQERTDFTFGKNKVSKGPRLIIIHIGGRDGFINELMEVYPVSKAEASEDYHSNVHGRKYIAWFNKLMTHLKTPHIIVMDNAPYHSVSQAPPLNSRKQVLLDWLKGQQKLGKPLKNQDLDACRLVDLVDEVRTIKQAEPQYVIDGIAREQGHKIVRLAPYNCMLNPIEYVWSDVKRKLREQNTDQNLRANVIRAKSIMQTYSKDLWNAHINHVKKLETEYWEGDIAFEQSLAANPEFEEIAYLEEQVFDGEIVGVVDNSDEDADDEDDTCGIEIVIENGSKRRRVE